MWNFWKYLQRVFFAKFTTNDTKKLINIPDNAIHHIPNGFLCLKVFDFLFYKLLSDTFL